MIFSVPPVYPNVGYNFLSRKKVDFFFIDSARSAIYLLGKKFNDHLFILPAYTCPTVWKALEQANASFEFVDIDGSLDFSHEDLAGCLAKHSHKKIILMPTSLFGVSIPDYKSIGPNCLVAEDRAQGLFDPNSSADFQIMSFGKGKMISGFGGGGFYDRNGLLSDELKDLPEKGNFIQSYVLSIAQKLISRTWFLIENSALDPEKNTKVVWGNVVPARLGTAKSRWICNTMDKLDVSKRIKLVNFYLKNLRRDVLFDLQPDIPYLRLPIKKRISYAGVSQMRDYHETYSRAVEVRGRELPGARRLVEASFLPTHDLVSMEYARKVVDIVNS